MDLEKIKSQLTILKNKVSDNEDRYFNEYYIDDILDAREYDLINNPITDFDWFLYWTDIKEDLTSIFSLFFQKETLNKSEYEVLCECVGLKRILDTKITKLPKWKEYESIDVIDYLESKNIPSYSLSKTIDIETIHNMHEFLITEKFISEISIGQFTKHFTDNTPNLIPIIWAKDAIRFVAFINSLYTLKIVDIKGPYKDKKWELAKQHFRKTDHSKFSTNILSNRSAQINYKEYYKFFETHLEKLLK